MIRIFSEDNDYSTARVIEWIQYFGCDTIRVNRGNSKMNFALYIDSDKILTNYYSKNDNYSVTWYRRGTLENADDYTVPGKLEENSFESIKEHLRKEFTTFREFYYEIGNSFDNPNKYEINKLNSLYLARKIGLRIPRTLVTRKRSDICEFLGSDKPLVCKPITDLLNVEYKGVRRSHLIKYLEEGQVDNLPEQFGLSLFQEFVKKKYDIRIFCIKDRLFSVANFSNLNNNSKIDGRNVYNDDWKINRIVPFLIPGEIQDKIVLLIRELGLDSGSLDFLRSTNDEFIFLEVNPVGQFGIVSKFGNFNIEKHIAKILCAYEDI